jgi:hypothetical protein
MNFFINPKLGSLKIVLQKCIFVFLFYSKIQKIKNILGHEEISSRAATNQNARRTTRLGIF